MKKLLYKGEKKLSHRIIEDGLKMRRVNAGESVEVSDECYESMKKSPVYKALFEAKVLELAKEPKKKEKEDGRISGKIFGSKKKKARSKKKVEKEGESQ